MTTEDQQTVLIQKLVTYAMIIGFFYIVGRFFFGNQIIDSWFEKPGEYTTQYWVFLEPENGGSKNYRVKSDIQKINGESGGYFVRKVYWPNGGYSEFDDCRLENKSGDYCIDYDSRGYTVRLGEKVK